MNVCTYNHIIHMVVHMNLQLHARSFCFIHKASGQPMLHAALSISEVGVRFSCTSLSRKSLPTRFLCQLQLCVSSDVARYGECSRMMILPTKVPLVTMYICPPHTVITPRETAYLKPHQSSAFSLYKVYPIKAPRPNPLPHRWSLFKSQTSHQVHKASGQPMLHATLSISEVGDRFSCTPLSRKSLPTRWCAMFSYMYLVMQLVTANVPG